MTAVKTLAPTRMRNLCREGTSGYLLNIMNVEATATTTVNGMTNFRRFL